MDEFIQEFLVEGSELLDQLDRDFVELEKDPTSKELIARIFRAIHTLKGTGGTIGLRNWNRSIMSAKTFSPGCGRAS